MFTTQILGTTAHKFDAEALVTTRKPLSEEGRTNMTAAYVIDDVVGRVLNATLLSRAAKVTHDILINAVFHGEIKPEQAELIAKQHGLPPLAPPQPKPVDYNAMLEPGWTVPMTIAWIAYRSHAQVLEVWDEYRCRRTGWRYRKQHKGWLLEFEKSATIQIMKIAEKIHHVQGTLPPGAIGIRDAKEGLRSALRRNKIQATGVKVGTYERDLIPDYEWRDLEFVEVRGRDCVRFRVRDGGIDAARGYDDLEFRSPSVIEIWPARRLDGDEPVALTEATGEEAAADREFDIEGEPESAAEELPPERASAVAPLQAEPLAERATPPASTETADEEAADDEAGRAASAHEPVEKIAETVTGPSKPSSKALILEGLLRTHGRSLTKDEYRTALGEALSDPTRGKNISISVREFDHLWRGLRDVISELRIDAPGRRDAETRKSSRSKEKPLQD